MYKAFHERKNKSINIFTLKTYDKQLSNFDTFKSLLHFF